MAKYEILDTQVDERVDCYSVLTRCTVESYLETVDAAYSSRSGGLEGQREPLKTTTAIRIRKRMVEDLIKGTILPPLVLGIKVKADYHHKVADFDNDQLSELIKKAESNHVSIIDGMQRTTALIEMVRDNPESAKRILRVEFWFSKTVHSLLYRMLILNTSQVPWTIKRQVEVVFRSMIDEMKDYVPSAEIFSTDEGRRRTQPGQIAAADAVELFIAFGSRKEQIDMKGELVDNFTRQDFTEAIGDVKFTEMFYNVFELLSTIDKMFDRAEAGEADYRFKNGKDLFSSQPARIGFIVAVAITILGRPGSSKRSQNEIGASYDELIKKGVLFIKRLENTSPEDIKRFLEYGMLNELLSSKKSGPVGRFEREFFLRAFQTLIDEEFAVESMAPCWRAY